MQVEYGGPGQSRVCADITPRLSRHLHISDYRIDIIASWIEGHPYALTPGVILQNIGDEIMELVIEALGWNPFAGLHQLDRKVMLSDQYPGMIMSTDVGVLSLFVTAT